MIDNVLSSRKEYAYGVGKLDLNKENISTTSKFFHRNSLVTIQM